MSAPSESGLIAALLARVPHRAGLEGPGDDAAVLPASGRRVITTDALIEGTHFLRAHPPEALGYKALAVNLSDVAAMGATPEAFVIAVALGGFETHPYETRAAGGGEPGHHDLRGWWEAFCDGLGACAREAGVVVAGGDMVGSPAGIAITITAWGAADALLTRDAGRPGDVLMVAGVVGRSGVGLSRWLAAQTVEPGDARAGLTPAPTDDLCLAHHLRPTPPLWAGPLAARLGVRCGMDLSDGLATDLPRLAIKSGVVLEVDLDALPPDPALAVGPIERARSGEDYGLAVLAPPDLVAALQMRGFTAIGRARAAGADGAGVLWRLAGEGLDAPVPSFGHFGGDRTAAES